MSGNNAFVANGANTIYAATTSPLSIGQIPLFNYTGVIGGAGFNGLTLGALPHIEATLVNNASSVVLNVTAADTIRWNGGNGNAWDVNLTQNWKTVTGNSDTTYMQTPALGDIVAFDDNAVGNFDVAVAEPVRPATITYNNSLHDYSLGGDAIGTVALAVTGSKNVTINNSDFAVSSEFMLSGSAQRPLPTRVRFPCPRPSRSTAAC